MDCRANPVLLSVFGERDNLAVVVDMLHMRRDYLVGISVPFIDLPRSFGHGPVGMSLG
jgi:hypothetical protein